MAMIRNTAWVIAILLLPVWTVCGLRAEEGEGAPTPDVQFIAPSDATQAKSQPVKQDETGGDGTFISPENAQPEEGTSAPRASTSKNEQDPAQLNQTILKKVSKRDLKVKDPKAPNSEEAGVDAVEQATNTGFAPGQAGAKDEPAAPGDAPKVKIDEKGANEVVKGAFTVVTPQGALAYFKGKTLLETTFYQAVQRAIDKNLSVKFADKAYERSSHGITRAKSVFDPVFSLTINGTQTDTFERREFINRRRFIAGELQNEIVDAIFNTTQAQEPNDPVEGFERRGAFERAGARARFRTETVGENFFLQMPWGPVFNLNFTQKHSKTIFQEFTTEDSFTINDSETGLDPNGQVQPILDSDGITTRKRSVFFEQHGRTARNRLQRPWSSSLNVRLVVPIPYTKDWGPYGAAEVPIKLTETSHEKAYWDLQSTINNTVLSVDLNYWNVVRAIRRLELTIRTRQGMEKVVGQTSELLKAGRKTEYDRSLVAQQLATIRRGEQAEWANYVNASNALKSILDEDKDTVILPVAYGELLSSVAPISPEDAMALAMAFNPDLQSSKLNVQLADISLKFAHNQARPDLKLTTGISWAQFSTNYGYSGVGPSMAALMRPDTRDSFAVLNYRVPWGNKPALERVNESEERYKQAQKALQLVASQVDRRVHDSLASLNSARERAEIAEKNREISDNLYKSSLELFDLQRVTNFELVNKNTDALNAGFRAIDAQIDIKQQEAQYRAAVGNFGTFFQDFKIILKAVDNPKKKDDDKDDEKDEKEKKDEKKEVKNEEPKKTEKEAVKEPVK